MDGLAQTAETTLGKRAPRILFVALSNDIGTDRVPAALAAGGADCAVLCPPGFYCSAPRGVRHWFRLPAHRGLWLGLPFVRPRLEAACREWEAELIVPVDSVSAQYLRVMARSKSITPHLRMLLQKSFGSPSGYSAACSRAGLMEVAGRLGVHLPRVGVSADPNELLARAEDWGFPIVLKTENTCGGCGVTVATTADELRAVLKRVLEGSVFRRMRRALGRAFWRMAGFKETAGAPPLLQSFMPGVPAMRTVSTWQGEVLEGVSFAAEKVFPAGTGPSTMVRFVENAQMEDTASRIVKELGCSGFMSFDFMLDETTGQAALIEANPRPIGTTHLGRLFGHDPCAPLLARLAGNEPAERPKVEGPPVVALFPTEIDRDPHNLERLTHGDVYHDVPFNEPAVVKLYLRRLSRRHPKEIATIKAAVDAVTAEKPVTSEDNDRFLPPHAFLGSSLRYP
jgi:hypothetical protein